jgi:hypothetical protein
VQYKRAASTAFIKLSASERARNYNSGLSVPAAGCMAYHVSPRVGGYCPSACHVSLGVLWGIILPPATSSLELEEITFPPSATFCYEYSGVLSLRLPRLTSTRGIINTPATSHEYSGGIIPPPATSREELGILFPFVNLARLFPSE